MIFIIYLYHDLGGGCYVDNSKENTGYQFTKFLEENGVTGLKEDIIVHSYNFAGTENIIKCFEKAKRWSFPADLKKNKSWKFRI